MCELTPNAAPLDELVGAVARFVSRAREADALPATVAEGLVRLRQACDALELEFSRDAAGFALTDEYDLQGAVSPIAWMKHNCKMSGHAAASAISVGRKADSLALSTGALAEGRIGFAHLVLLSRTAEAVEISDARFDEKRLLRQAESHTLNRFRRDCAHARHAADAAAFLAEQREWVGARFLELRSGGDGGCWSLRGFLDPVGGATLAAALEPLARRGGVEDDRVRSRRMADALVELSAHGLDTGMRSPDGRHVPHLQVTTTLATLLGLPGAPAGGSRGRRRSPPAPSSASRARRTWFACCWARIRP